MKMSTFLRKVLDDELYRTKKSLAYDNYNLFKEKNNIISEELFLELITKMQNNDEIVAIYRDISGLLLIKENVTPRVFRALVKMSKKSKFNWNFVYLCHAELSNSQKSNLKKLNLNDAYFY